MKAAQQAARASKEMRQAARSAQQRQRQQAQQQGEKASESLATRLYRITCNVTYVGGDGKERTLSLATIRVSARSPT